MPPSSVFASVVKIVQDSITFPAGSFHLSSKDTAPNSGPGSAPYKLYNIGNHQPVELMKVIQILEECLGKPARKNMLPMQPGDVPATFADVADLMRDTGFRPTTPIEVGLKHFTDWYLGNYKRHCEENESY